MKKYRTTDQELRNETRRVEGVAWHAWSAEQTRLAEDLDDALFWLGRERKFVEGWVASRLKFALRRALLLAKALRREVGFGEFRDACARCLGEPKEWAGTEVEAALLAVLLWVPGGKEPRMDTNEHESCVCDETQNEGECR